MQSCDSVDTFLIYFGKTNIFQNYTMRLKIEKKQFFKKTILIQTLILHMCMHALLFKLSVAPLLQWLLHILVRHTHAYTHTHRVLVLCTVMVWCTNQYTVNADRSYTQYSTMLQVVTSNQSLRYEWKVMVICCFGSGCVCSIFVWCSMLQSCQLLLRLAKSL